MVLLETNSFLDTPRKRSAELIKIYVQKDSGEKIEVQRFFFCFLFSHAGFEGPAHERAPAKTRRIATKKESLVCAAAGQKGSLACRGSEKEGRTLYRPPHRQILAISDKVLTNLPKKSKYSAISKTKIDIEISNRNLAEFWQILEKFRHILGKIQQKLTKICKKEAQNHFSIFFN